MTLKIGVSGIRGIVGRSLTREVSSGFIKAFAAFVGKGMVIVARDTRASGKALEDLAVSDLTSLGINAIKAGICPTPTALFIVKKLKLNGAVIITASHNPPEWNGYKFASKNGVFLNAGENKRLIGIYRSGRSKISGKKGSIINLSDPFECHIKAVLTSVDAGNIRRKKFKVVLDSCNGAGSLITVRLLKKLNCRVVPLFTDPSKDFPRGAEPVPSNLHALCAKVKKVKADIGFAQDPDADRLSIVDEKGRAIGEEYSLALSAMHVLSLSGPKAKRKIVTNLSTSMMIDDVAKKYGARVIRTKVGEINVVEKLMKVKAIIGGEGNGGIIYPKVLASRDSLTGIALILGLMADRNKNISAIASEVPKYHMVKSKILCRSKKDAQRIINRARSLRGNGKISSIDGIKVIFRDSWIHVRPSNTEPVIRIIAEGRNRNAVEELLRSLGS